MSEKKMVTQSWLSAIDDRVVDLERGPSESLRRFMLWAFRRAGGETFPLEWDDILKIATGKYQLLEEGPLPL